MKTQREIIFFCNNKRGGNKRILGVLLLLFQLKQVRDYFRQSTPRFSYHLAMIRPFIGRRWEQIALLRWNCISSALKLFLTQVKWWL